MPTDHVTRAEFDSMVQRLDTIASLEPVVERALGSVLTPRRKAVAPQVRVVFMDEHEVETHGEQAMRSELRLPDLTFNGGTYTASRQDRDTWIYRETHRG